MNLLLVLLLGWQTAYLTEHPGRADWWVLATQEGLFSVAPTGSCSGLGANVVVEQDIDEEVGEGFLIQGQESCWLVLEQQESAVPCFQTDGECDIDGE